MTSEDIKHQLIIIIIIIRSLTPLIRRRACLAGPKLHRGKCPTPLSLKPTNPIMFLTYAGYGFCRRKAILQPRTLFFVPKMSARHLRSLSPTSSCAVHLGNIRLYFAIAQGVADRSVKLKGIRIHVYTLNHYQILSLAGSAFWFSDLVCMYLTQGNTSWAPPLSPPLFPS